ncbi:MAG: hypothetical protein LW816_12605 [Planctomyces sp.]|jgi:hypothetical protein|nr:hypothetical protein [Planctomyces sp.]
MNPFPWLSLVTPVCPASTSVVDSGPASAVSSGMQIVQWWLGVSSPLPILPMPCTFPGPQAAGSDAGAVQAATERDELHVIAVASPAELQNSTVEYAVRLATAAAARLTIMPLDVAHAGTTGRIGQHLSADAEPDQQIRLRLAETDYRTLPHGVRIAGPAQKLSDALADSIDSRQFTVLLVSARELGAWDPVQHDLPQLLLIPGVAILAHAEPEHE